MEDRFISNWVFRLAGGIALVIALLLFGCSRAEEKRDCDGSSSVLPPVEAELEVVLPPNQVLAREMRRYLDDEDIGTARKLARSLQNAPEKDVRLEVVDVLGWIGKRALPDLEMMFNDHDEEVSEAAVTAWEAACSEENSERVISLHVQRAAPKLKNKSQMEAVLLKLTMIDEKIALDCLDKIIMANQGKAISTVAKGYFLDLSEEPWESSSRTLKLIEKLKKE